MLLSRRGALVFGIADLTTAVLVGLGVFVALPARWWPVDVGAAALIVVELAAAGGLLLRAPWGERAARVTAGFALAVGLFTVSLLAITASWLGGVYGPVGKGGAIVLALVAALALPYVVALPLVQLYWLRPPPRGGAPGT